MGPAELARAYWDSEESRDLDRILAHFTPDATWFGPAGDFHGADQFSAYYAGSIAGYPDLSLTIVETLGDTRRAAIRWDADLADHEGHRFTLHGVNFMTWEDGLITDLATFYDVSALPPS